ncbi:MAG: xanthine dehydrogenase family protein molybdopterin-binding subunit [Phycisphaerales bacterium]
MADLKRLVTTGMATDNRPANMGDSIDDQTSRFDGVAKVTGRGVYSRDRYLENSLFVAFVRCPWGKARLRSVDREAALAVPGVVEVVMDGERGQYHGHNIGYVVAESKTALRRGMRALDAQWDRDRPDTRIEDAMEDAPAPDGKTDAILQDADIVFEAVYTTPVATHSPLETHGAVVVHEGDRATVYVSTQGTQAATDGLADPLGLPRSNYEVICEFIGGGFGSKLNGAGKEGAIAAEVSKKYRRPVSLFTDRDEDHLDTGNRPSSRNHVRIGVARDGRILGGQVHTWGGVGVAGSGGGSDVPSGRYNLGEIQRSHENVRFNGGAPRPFRAPGSPQGAFAEEMMLDEIAALAGLDPIGLRLQHETDDHRKEMLELGAQLIGWRDRRPNGTSEGPVKRGFGCGTASWPRFPARAEAEVVINRDGSVVARTGTQDIGTGQRTIMGVVAADYLGVPLEWVEVEIGRGSLPPGPASGGSMTAHNTAPAMMGAAEDAKRKFLQLVADREGIDASELDLYAGQVLRHGEPVTTFEQACRRMGRDSVTGRGEHGRDTGQEYVRDGHSHGAQFVDLRVDTETGVIHVDRVVAIQACGRVIARKTAESQIIGGVIQGLSYALFEDKILDRHTGAMVNPNLEMYKILGPADMPHIEPVLWTKGQTGVRSLGEPPIIPTAGAVACAVLNAVGAPVRSLPLTPDLVLDAVERSA